MCDSDKAALLVAVESLGRDVANKAKPDYWAYEDMARATEYARWLPYLRTAYRQIKADAPPVAALKALRPVIVTGIERNFLDRCIDLANQFTR